MADSLDDYCTLPVLTYRLLFLDSVVPRQARETRGNLVALRTSRGRGHTLAKEVESVILRPTSALRPLVVNTLSIPRRVLLTDFHVLFAEQSQWRTSTSTMTVTVSSTGRTISILATELFLKHVLVPLFASRELKSPPTSGNSDSVNPTGQTLPVQLLTTRTFLALLSSFRLRGISTSF